MLEFKENGKIEDDGVLQIGRIHEAAGEVVNVLELKQRIFDELDKEGFPDLSFLFSPKSVAVMGDVLNELLKDAKRDFQNICNLRDEEVNINIFFNNNHLSYLYMLLRSFKDLDSNIQIRGVLETFKEKLLQYKNEVSFSLRYYEVLKICSLQDGLSPEEKRFLEVKTKEYEKRGINLDVEKQGRLKQINTELSILSAKYSDNLVDEEESVNIHITDREVLGDMPIDVIEEAQKRAEDKKEKGYIFGINQVPTLMDYCVDRDIRESTYRTYTSLASTGQKSNRESVMKMLHLRDERAKILGYTSHADYAMNTKMSDSYEEVAGKLEEIYKKAEGIALQDIEGMKQYFGLNELEAWDYKFYRKKYEKALNNFDISSVKPYLEVEQVIGGMFDIIKELFDITLTEIDVAVYGKGNVYEAYKDGVLLGYLWCDFYESDKKMTGAWAEPIRSGSRLNKKGEVQKKHKIVINASNITKKTQGDTLLEFDDVETLFHELGHALHVLCYGGKFGSLGGLSTEDDFVELPSQLLENWCRSPQGLKRIAKHHQTGKEISDEMIENIIKSNSFNPAYSVVRTLMLSFYDLALHSKYIPEDGDMFDIFSSQEHQAKSLFEVPEYYKLYGGFDHPFYEADSTYAAGYFSYIWAQLIEKDVWKAFQNSGDVFNKELAEKYYRIILEQGAMKPGSDLFQELMGRGLDTDAYLESQGLL